MNCPEPPFDKDMSIAALARAVAEGGYTVYFVGYHSGVCAFCVDLNPLEAGSIDCIPEKWEGRRVCVYRDRDLEGNKYCMRHGVELEA
jgi:hypothetical protein